MLQYTGFLNTMTGILTTIFIVTSPLNMGQMIQEIRQWKSEQERTSIEEMLNNTLMEYTYGSDGSTESEELLQLSSGEDKQSS